MVSNEAAWACREVLARWALTSLRVQCFLLGIVEEGGPLYADKDDGVVGRQEWMLPRPAILSRLERWLPFRRARARSLEEGVRKERDVTLGGHAYRQSYC